ncbi:MAG: NADH-quinone oxidoreductase subunit C [Pseudomonadota bacterium]|nr:NADH-quinone oxidoreductase subunit C [Pseudomonadota bacterium]
MSQAYEALAQQLGDRFPNAKVVYDARVDEVTVEVAAENLLESARVLRDDEALLFRQLIDLCGVDYLAYGDAEWATVDSTELGFSRGVDRYDPDSDPDHGSATRYAVAYHLLSLDKNLRLRVRVWIPDSELPVLPSVVEIWPVANWFEREAFDLFGIHFENHPDLRRLLTDYGFIGYPFRKDFPLIGNVEVRYNPEKGRVVYEPVQIEPRTLVPKVIREDQEHGEIAGGASQDA